MTTHRHVLLTGITGNLGAFAACRLLARGHTVHAVIRARSDRYDPGRRVTRSMRVFAPASDVDAAYGEGRLRLLRADICDREALLAQAPSAPIDETWHFASTLKYMPKDHDEIHAVNVGGLLNTMELHLRSARPDAPMFYVGTAYVGGKGTARVPERRLASLETNGFHNPYESSKLQAENLFLDAVEGGRLRGAVFRPSIVVGDRLDARLVNYHGYYLGLRVWLSLERYLRRRKERTRIRVGTSPSHGLNLIGIDDVIGLMLQARDGGWVNGGVYNVVNEAEATMGDVFSVLGGQLPSIDFELLEPEAFQAAKKTRYEKLVSYGTTYVAPYMHDHIRFDTDRLAAAVGARFALRFDRERLARLNSVFFNQCHEAEGG